MKIKDMISHLLFIGVIISACVVSGCAIDSGGCTHMECFDTLIIRVLPADSYVPGVYSSELVFSDGVSITAAFEVVQSIPGPENTAEAMDNLSLSAIAMPNESYPISWLIYDGLPNHVKIVYYGEILANDTILDYAFTDLAQIHIKRDGTLILSKVIEPDYDYYWCNQEAGKCDPSQNRYAEIELKTD